MKRLAEERSAEGITAYRPDEAIGGRDDAQDQRNDVNGWLKYTISISNSSNPA